VAVIINLQSVSKTYRVGGQDLQVLKPTTLQIGAGEFTALIGPSGSGKSTLLNLMTGIDHPTGGMVTVGGANFGGLNESALAKLRGQKVGIVFQFFQLVPTLTSAENVMLAMDLVGGVPGRERRKRALDLLEQMGVGAQANKLPSRLSGGEQQRVAVARALANDPEVLVADEPTGNLDSENGAMVMELFAKFARDGRTVVVATHDPQGRDRYDRILTMKDGVLSEGERANA